MALFRFSVWFRYLQSTADFITVATDISIGAFNRSGATGTTRAMTLDISKAFTKF